MGRQEIIQHIGSELSGQGENTTIQEEITDIFCQYCGCVVETDGEQPDDFVVHSIPSHGESDRNFVFYCGPTCFQEGMEELLEV